MVVDLAEVFRILGFGSRVQRPCRLKSNYKLRPLDKLRRENAYSPRQNPKLLKSETPTQIPLTPSAPQGQLNADVQHRPSETR